MPRSAVKPCSKAGCGKLTSGRFCDIHEAQHRERIRNGYAGGTTTERGYGAAWRKRRAYVMRRDDYLCQPCKRTGRLTEASEVDHIIPKARGGTDEEGNLQAICRACHMTKTAREHR